MAVCCCQSATSPTISPRRAVHGDAGQAQAGRWLIKLDSAGKEQPVQFWRVKMHEDGSLASARISFYAELAQGGDYRYTLETGVPGSASSVPKATVPSLQSGIRQFDVVDFGEQIARDAEAADGFAGLLAEDFPRHLLGL